MKNQRACELLMLALCMLLVSNSKAAGQTTADSSWNAEVSVGWDIDLSGDFLSAGIGTLNGFPTVIAPQSFGDVYGTGVHWQFSGGYLLDEINEVRAQFSYQRAGSDVVDLGTAGGSALVGTFDDYKAWSIEGGYRHYFAPRSERLRPYAGGAIGVSIIGEIDGIFSATQAGLTRYSTDFYDGTAAFTLAANGGALYGLTDKLDLNVQLGFRFNSGLSQIDSLRGTDLEGINDKSARWTMPLMVGLRFNF